MELKSFSPERLFIKVLVLDFFGCVFFYHEINESFIPVRSLQQTTNQNTLMKIRKKQVNTTFLTFI